MLNFKSSWAAKDDLTGIEFMQMIRKRQPMMEDAAGMTVADRFYALAGKIRPG
jgi:putative transposase